jgi:hypothetical protein
VRRLETPYDVGPDVDVAQLIRTEQQRNLLNETGRVIEFTFVDGYAQLTEIIKAHGYDLARHAGRLPTPEQVAADWYDTVYLPGCNAARRAGLPEIYASWQPTEADFFLWLYKLRRDLRVGDPAIDFDAAAVHARETTHHERSRRQFRRGDGHPLPRRDD